MNKNSGYYCLFYALISDIIGFDNGLKSIDKSNLKCTNLNEASKHAGYTNYIVYKFISHGAYSNINISKKLASNASIFLLSVYDSFVTSKLTDPSNINLNTQTIIDNLIVRMSEYFNSDKNKQNRLYDNDLIEKLDKLSDFNYNYSKFSYDEEDNSCYPLVRGVPIGIIFSGKKNRDKLLEISIESCRTTHNNAISYLGTFTTALFISLSLEKVNPNKWIHILLNFFLEGKIVNYIKKTIPKKDIKPHLTEINEFQYLINNYKLLRFDKDSKYIPSSEDKYFMFLNDKSLYMYAKFGLQGIFNPGSNGIDCIIYAYDAFMESGSNFEKLIYNSMLHVGVSHYTGCLAGALYGSYYGNSDLQSKFDNFDLKNKLDKLTNLHYH